MSIPVLLPPRDGLKEPRHDGMELDGTDAGNAFRLGQGSRPAWTQKRETQWRVGSQALTGETIFIKNAIH